MRPMPLLAVALSLFASCDLGESVDQNSVPVDFVLLNAGGWQSSAFTIGDTVFVHFKLTNKLGRPITYFHTGPLIILQILQGDSVVATSVDGLAFPQDAMAAVLQDGQSVTADWPAPNAPWSSRTIVLYPGVYRAAVAHSDLFNRLGIQPPTPIQFTVYPGLV